MEGVSYTTTFLTLTRGELQFGLETPSFTTHDLINAQITEPRSHSVTWGDAHRAISSSIMLVVITNNNIYKWELFQYTYLPEKHKYFQILLQLVCLLQNT